MHKHALTLLLLFGMYTYASAQTSTAPITTAAIAPVTAISAADTIQAVHQLFKKRRTGGGVWVTIGAAFTGRIIGSLLTSSGGNGGGAIFSIVLFGGGPAAIGFGKLSRFSATREAQVLSTYEQTKNLPVEIRNRLTPKYFNK